jgi:ATP-dependent DNA helicase RecQ
MRLAGRDAGPLFDKLAQIHLDLQRGTDGIDKPLSCTQSTLRQIAERKPTSLSDLDRIPGMDGARTDRFGLAFLAAIAGD